MEDMEKLLKSMTQMKDGMESMQKELASYTENMMKMVYTVKVRGWINQEFEVSFCER
jgi:DNA-binding protein YbaB